jgi:glycosyltransferase involved in cell wall biosynthesis
MIDPRPLEEEPNPVVLRMFDDAKTNFLFVGRCIPNKRIEDVIKVFCYYQRFIDPNSRLLLVGETHGFERYFDSLVRLVDDLALEDVVFTGHVDTDDLAAYYRVADLFLSMSEHEGFCAPLLEAFRFGLPVMAFDAGAVAETLSGAGVLVQEKSFDRIAEMAHLLVHDESLRERVVAGQNRVLERRVESRDEEALLMDFVERTRGN